MKILDLSFKAGASRICLSKDYSDLPEQLSRLGFDRSAIVITDQNVATHYQSMLAKVLSHMKLDWIYLAKGEAGKINTAIWSWFNRLMRSTQVAKPQSLHWAVG